jgi:hypothetical protein
MHCACFIFYFFNCFQNFKLVSFSFCNPGPNILEFILSYCIHVLTRCSMSWQICSLHVLVVNSGYNLSVTVRLWCNGTDCGVMVLVNSFCFLCFQQQISTHGVFLFINHVIVYIIPLLQIQEDSPGPAVAE